MDAFFKKSVENEESTENLQKTHKNQYYLMKNRIKKPQISQTAKSKATKKTKKTPMTSTKNNEK